MYLDKFVYRAALLHAFFTSIDNCDVMTYDIINQELHSNYFYATFLNSIEYMSCLLREVLRWSYKEFCDVILNNESVTQLLFKSWKQYLEVTKEENPYDDNYKHQYALIADMHNLDVSPYWTEWDHTSES